MKAAELLKIKLSEENNNEFISLDCFAHELNTILENSLETPDIKKIIDKIRVVCSFMKRSCKANDKLK